MPMSWDDMQAELYKGKESVPKVKDYIHAKDDHYGWIDQGPVVSADYSVAAVRFELRWQVDMPQHMRQFNLEVTPANGSKYSMFLNVSETHIVDMGPSYLADMMIDMFYHEMKAHARPSNEIKCMQSFIKKLAWDANKLSGSKSEQYNYLLEPKYHTGGIVMSQDGMAGPWLTAGKGYSKNGNAYITGMEDNYRQPEVDLLPGIKEHVKHPVTGNSASIEGIIIDLNDFHKWTRDQIADWLETLDVDLTFKDEPAKVDKIEPDYQAAKLANLQSISMQVALDKINPDALKLLFGADEIEKLNLGGNDEDSI